MSIELQEQLALLPGYLGAHIRLSVLAILIGLVISLPLAILATRIRRLEWPLVAVANVLQTIPALALLAFMVPLLGKIGFLPALIALVLYSALPVIRNTITGIQQVDPALVEAGRGLGMTDRQLLFRVQLPLAGPTILAGVRIAVVWVVGIATLSTPVGAPSLGNYIFSGLQTQNFTAVVVGVVSAASLALVLDGLIRLLEWSYRRRRMAFAVAALAGLLVILLLPTLYVRRSRPPLVIGAKTFTEQYILAEVLKSRLGQQGIAGRVVASLGSTVAFDGLQQGQIDLYVDYSGTIWANHMKRDEVLSRQEVLEEMSSWLEEEYGLRCLGSLGFENAYALAMRREQARQLHVRTVSELVGRAENLVMGADYEFFSRPEWKSLVDVYGLNFGDRVSLDSTLMYGAVASGQVDVISAFSTDGRIDAFDLQVIEDDRRALPPYDAVLLLSPNRAREEAVVRALSPLIGAISNEEMRQANRMVDLDGKSVGEAARWLLSRVPTGNQAQPLSR